MNSPRPKTGAETFPKSSVFISSSSVVLKQNNSPSTEASQQHFLSSHSCSCIP